MIDELGLKAVDYVIEHFSAWCAPWKIRLKRSFIGFRPLLIWERMKNLARMMRSSFVRAGEEGSFFVRMMTEPVEPVNEVSFRQFIDASLTGASSALSGRAFAATLLMMMMSVCLLAGRGGGEMAMLCAFFCLQWLAEGMEMDWAPVASGVHQKYLTAMGLRALAYLAAAVSYFFAYARHGLQINIILQGTMGLTIAVHAILFVSFVAFNQRQQLFLRVLSGVLGFLPALMCACAAALGASTAAASAMIAAGGVVRGLGAGLAFLSEEASMIASLGGNRLRFGRLWRSLLSMTGFFMMLLGAWLCAQ